MTDIEKIKRYSINGVEYITQNNEIFRWSIIEKVQYDLYREGKFGPFKVKYQIDHKDSNWKEFEHNSIHLIDGMVFEVTSYE
jgi:hypothetical protein